MLLFMRSANETSKFRTVELSVYRTQAISSNRQRFQYSALREENFCNRAFAFSFCADNA